MDISLDCIKRGVIKLFDALIIPFSTGISLARYFLLLLSLPNYVEP